MALEAFESGEPFPISLPSGEGLFPLLSGESLLLAFLAKDLSRSEIHKVRSEPMKIGILVEEGVPFIAMGVQSWGVVDGSMNPYMYETPIQEQFLRGDGNVLTITLVEGRRQIVRGNRIVGMSDLWMRTVRNGYRTCRDRYEDGAAVNAAVSNVYNRHVHPKDILEAADVTDSFYKSR